LLLPDTLPVVLAPGTMTFLFNLRFNNRLFNCTGWNCYLYGFEYLLTWDFGRY
jgi:hypothetical protein